jgi:hypothetical protein
MNHHPTLHAATLAAQAATLVACAAAPSAPTRVDLGPIPPDQLAGDRARAVVVFGRGDAREAPPGPIDQTLLDDELVLLTNAPVPCVRVTLTTEASYDQNFEALAPTCEVDGGRATRAEVREERAHPASFWYEYYPAGSFEPVEDALNVVARHGTICCPDQPANRSLRFTLSNSVMGLDDEEPWRAVVYWALSL